MSLRFVFSLIVISALFPAHLAAWAVEPACAPVIEAKLTAMVLAAKTVKKYDTVEMSSYFKGETSPDWHPEKHRKYVVHYLTDEEREAHRVVIIDGTVYDSKGNRYVPPKNRLNYVMDEFGNHYFFDQVGHEEIRHSSVLGGKPVAGAGEVTLDESAKILKINGDSGHYPQKDHKHLDHVLAEMKDDGVDVSRITILDPPGDLWTPAKIWKRLNSVAKPDSKVLLQKKDISGVLKWLADNLRELRDFSDSQLKDDDLTHFKQLLDQIDGQLKKFNSGDVVDHEEYLKTTERLALGLGIRAHLADIQVMKIERADERWEDLMMRLKEYAADPNFTHFKEEVFKYRPRFLALPVLGDLDIADFNRQQATLVRPLGLIRWSAYADGIRRNPYEFLFHDEEHFVGLVTTELKEWGDEAAWKAFLAARENFQSEYDHFKESHPDPKKQRLFDLIWFDLFHEIEQAFQSDHVAEILESPEQVRVLAKKLLERVNEPNDFKGVLEEPLPSVDDVISAFNEIHDFAKSLIGKVK